MFRVERKISLYGTSVSKISACESSRQVHVSLRVYIRRVEKLYSAGVPLCASGDYRQSLLFSGQQESKAPALPSISVCFTSGHPLITETSLTRVTRRRQL